MQNFFLFILFILVAFLWSSTWIATKFIVSTIPSTFATGLRFLISSPIILFLAYFKKIPIICPPGQRLFQFIVSIFYFTIPFSCMIYSGKYVKLPISSLIVSQMPITILLISSFLGKKKINLYQLFGIFLSFISLVCIFYLQWNFFNFHQKLSIFLLLLSSTCHAFIYVLSKEKYSHISIISFNGLPSLFAGVLLTGIGWVIEKPIIASFSSTSLLALFYLSIFVGIFGILCYFYLQRKIGELYSSLIFIIFPIISLIVDFFIYQNYMPKLIYIYMILSLIGIIITLFSAKKYITIKKKIFH